MANEEYGTLEGFSRNPVAEITPDAAVIDNPSLTVRVEPRE